jgi:D-galactarolactone isomerase
VLFRSLDGHRLAEQAAALAGLPCPLVIDHLAKFLSPVGPDSPGFLALRRLLDAGRTWIKLSAPYESSQAGPPGYDDVTWIAEHLARAYPERCLWASNWPHPNIRPTPSCSALLDWFFARVGDDDTRQRILVDNPAQLYGF